MTDNVVTTRNHSNEQSNSNSNSDSDSIGVNTTSSTSDTANRLSMTAEQGSIHATHNLIPITRSSSSLTQATVFESPSTIEPFSRHTTIAIATSTSPAIDLTARVAAAADIKIARQKRRRVLLKFVAVFMVCAITAILYGVEIAKQQRKQQQQDNRVNEPIEPQFPHPRPEDEIMMSTHPSHPPHLPTTSSTLIPSPSTRPTPSTTAVAPAAPAGMSPTTIASTAIVCIFVTIVLATAIFKTLGALRQIEKQLQVAQRLAAPMTASQQNTSNSDQNVENGNDEDDAATIRVPYSQAMMSDLRHGSVALDAPRFPHRVQSNVL
ncbi:hypothetical protein GQ42DRAFT_163760 [Ramicandelaber brevisporus]|nr:hypothetical protein GQ42DRAFT_163760 [Ramicandelaber brevisporus]